MHNTLCMSNENLSCPPKATRAHRVVPQSPLHVLYPIRLFLITPLPPLPPPLPNFMLATSREDGLHFCIAPHFSWVSLVPKSLIFSVTSSIGPLVSPALNTISPLPLALPSPLLALPPTLFSSASTCPNNQSTTSFLSFTSASNTASCPALLKIVISPPASINSFTASRCPLRDAQWSGVLPEAFVRFRKGAGLEVEVEMRSLIISIVTYQLCTKHLLQI